MSKEEVTERTASEMLDIMGIESVGGGARKNSSLMRITSSIRPPKPKGNKGCCGPPWKDAVLARNPKAVPNKKILK